MNNQDIYLDNAATTKPYPEVVQAMNEFLMTNYGNPSSLHRMGVEAERAIKRARESVAKPLGIEAENLIFTSGGTEGNNLCILGVARALQKRGDHVITTRVEHASVLKKFEYLAEIGYHVSYLDVNINGDINLNQLRELMTDKTILVSVMSVNNEIGTIFPISDIVKVVKEKNPQTLVHTDAVQAFLKISTPLKQWGVDLATVSAHKVHGIKGVGAVYIQKGVRMLPMLYGGGQERGLRPGTENTVGIIAFGKACEIGLGRFQVNQKHLHEIHAYSVSQLEEKLQDVVIHGDREHFSPHVLNFSVLGIRSEVLLHALEDVNIYISTGSACQSRKKTVSHVLEAMGFPRNEMESAIRISFSYETNKEHIDRLVDALVNKVAILRKFRRR